MSDKDKAVEAPLEKDGTGGDLGQNGGDGQAAPDAVAAQLQPAAEAAGGTGAKSRAKNRKIRVRVGVVVHGKGENAGPGSEVTVDADTAASLVEHGQAEYVD